MVFVRIFSVKTQILCNRRVFRFPNYLKNHYKTFRNFSTESEDPKDQSPYIKEQLRHLESLKQYPLFSHTVEDNARLLDPNEWEFSNTVSSIRETLPKVPSVSRILDTTMSEDSRNILLDWQERMIAKLGEEGFKTYRKELFANGENLHACLAEHLSKGTALCDLPLIPENQGYLQSLQHALEFVSDVKLVENTVQHPLLGYMGIFDCLARYRNQLLVIEWKTSSRPKWRLEHTYDNPLQAVAYLGAINHSPEINFRVRGALIVIAYKTGKPAHAHWMSPQLCQEYWDQWLERLHLYWSMRLQGITPPPPC